MRLKLLAKDKNSMEVEVLDEDSTLLNPLVESLLADPKVDYATFYRDHPLLDNYRIYVRVKEGKPQTALKRAAKAMGKEYTRAKEIFERLLHEGGTSGS